MSSLQRPVQSPYHTAASATASIHLRRPPDVEEALSSMLWTPYERTPTDTSSEEDDDERLNRRLCRSHTFAAMSDTATAAINASYFGDDLAGYGEATTPVATFVPFPTSANCCPAPSPPALHPATQLTPAVGLRALDANHSHPHSHHQQHNHHKNYDSSVGNYRFSYPYYSPIPSLNKWWSAAEAATVVATDTSSTVVTNATAVALPASQSDTEGRLSAESGLVREPPSYESLYARHTSGHRAVKALRPMLNTLKATISGVRHKQQSTAVEADNQDVIMRRAANERLVHSFTDDFIAESDRQHVASTTNVAHHHSHQRSINDHHESESPANARSQQNAEETHHNNNTNNNHHFVRQPSTNNNNSTERDMQNSEQVTQPVWPHETHSKNTAKSTASEPRRERSLRRIAAATAVQATCHRSSTVSLATSLNAATSTTSSGGVWHVACNNNQQQQQQLALEPSSAELGTPNNKCLAELERLYEEFRLSESLRELKSARGGVSANNNSSNNNNNNGSNTELATHRASNNLTRVEGDFGAATMRLNVPAATTAVDSSAAVSTTTTTTTTSSVFLTTTNSVTTNCNVASSKALHPCQRQPSLTIQVNNNNNNNNNNLIDNNKIANLNNNNTINGESDTKDLTILNNNHGVSVVNCGGVASVSVNRPPCLSVSSDATKSPSVHTRDVNCNAELATSTVATATATSDSESVKVINIKAASTEAKAPKPRHHSEIAASTTNNNNNHSPSRTFTSTECQTDDLATVEMRSPRRHAADTTTPSSSSTSREQRRRERRERRHQAAISGGGPSLVPHRRHNDRHSMPAALMGPPHLHPHSMPPGSMLGHLGPPPPPPHHMLTHVMAPPTATMPSAMSAMLRPMLPDILNSHFPPPYSALPPPAGPPVSNSPGRGGAADGMTATAAVMGAAQQTGAPQQTVIPGATLLTPVISTLPIPGATPIMGDGRFTLPLPIMRRSPSERSGKGCCGQWFAGPPLRALIAVVALGGVACALGGAALGATGLAGTPSSHLTAALLMIGVGVVLVTVSGAAWRMTAPGGPPCLGLGSSVDLGRCGRRPCSRGGGAPHGLLYPEFQHRPPPPSYQASMQEYRLRLLLLDRDRQNGVIRGNSPPPTYRSHAGSLLRAPLTTTIRGGGCGSSSVGGSEYSLPPSYRSRNTTPATVSSERSIETAPSGRLLANEDLPEPCLSGAEHLPDYDSIRLHPPATPVSRRGNKLTTTNAAAATTTTMTSGAATAVSGDGATSSAIIEVEPANRRNCNANKEKLNPRVFGIKEQLSRGDRTSGKDLVTIVTISQGDSQVSSPAGGGASSKPDEQIEILAHL